MRMLKRRLVVAAVAVACVGVSYGVVRYVRHLARAVPTGRIEKMIHLQHLVETTPTAASHRQLADMYVDVTQYERGSENYARASDIYRAKGDVNAAYAIGRLAERYHSTGDIYFHRRPEMESVSKFYTGSRLEPIYGCYTGAFIDHEDSISGTYRDEYGAWRRDITAFNHLVGSKQAIYFIYQGYGREFPKKFVRHLNDSGASAQIAFEPTDLDDVKNDAYLQGWAKAAKESKTPIFLRFASEMNGDWTPYHNNPELYIAKFQLVASVMHKLAPNVAMVWCPFEIPQRLIEPYYPGPAAVDWVGVNIYSVPFNDNDPKRDATWRNPADALKFVYEKYSAKHPIMIAEYAASHKSSLDMVDRPDFAQTKMGQFYASLPRLYPRVKAVCWLSMNAIKHAIPGRQNNDYSLLENNDIRKRYEQLLYAPYFLTAVSRHEPALAGEEILPCKDGQTLSGKVGLSAWVHTYEDRPTVVWKVNGEERVTSDLAGPYKWTLDTTTLTNGPVDIELIVTDSHGKCPIHLTRRCNVLN